MSSLTLSSFACVGHADQQPEDGCLDGGSCPTPSSASSSSFRLVVGCEDSSSFPSSFSPSHSRRADTPTASPASFSSSRPSAAASPSSSDPPAASSRRPYLPPFAAQRPLWLQVTRPRFLLCLNIAQLSFHFTVICLALYFLCLGDDVHSIAAEAAQHSAFACLLVFICALLLRSVIASGLIMLRVWDPQLWRQSAPAWYRRVQLLLLPLSAVATVIALVPLVSISVPPSSSLFIPWLLLWGWAGAELFSALLTLYLYAHLHLVFPHAALSLQLPIVKVDDQAEEEETTQPAEGRPTREQLDAIPCLTYRENMRCDRLCCICLLDMQPGDSFRLFSCKHGQSPQAAAAVAASPLLLTARLSADACSACPAVRRVQAFINSVWTPGWSSALSVPCACRGCECRLQWRWSLPPLLLLQLLLLMNQTS